MLKKILYGLGLIVAAVGSIYFYYVYTPEPVLPILNGKLSHHSLVNEGIERHYAVYQPETVTQQPPVVFVLHGSRGTGLGMRDYTAREFDLEADKHGLIVVYPNGFDNHWNDCRGSADYLANKQNIDDVGFFARTIEQLEADYAIDRQQVFVTGFSNGGHMVFKLAMEAPDMFSAYAAISANLPVDDNLDCEKKGRAVSIAIINGTTDPINPYQGGLVSVMGNDSRGEVQSTEQTVAYWRELAGLTEESITVHHPEIDGDETTSVIEQRWGQHEIKQVRLYRLQGSGHVIPSQIRVSPEIFGGNAGDISGAEEIVNFFLKK